ncbi:MAG: hypothetical protein AB1941_29980 [Gemmatimonadota bacterium]
MRIVRILFAAFFLPGAFTAAPSPAQSGGDAVTGRVVAADGGSAAGVRVVVSGAAFADSATTDSAGSYTLRLPARVRDDSVELVAREADPVSGRYHPAAVRLARRDLAGEHAFVLVPRAWTIPAGTYAGTTVEISLRRAFQPVCGGCSAFLRRSSVVGGGVRTWPDALFPLRVVFDREFSPLPISPRDSVSFWRGAEELERDFGADLLRPAPYSASAPVGDSVPSDLIFVLLDPSLRVSGLGTAGAYGDDIVFGEVRFKGSSLLAGGEGRDVVVHELMHAMGLGHTCSWRSVMAVSTRCPGMRSERATPEDVAYAQVVRRVRQLQRQVGARWGLEAALAGEEREIGSFAVVAPGRTDDERH